MHKTKTLVILSNALVLLYGTLQLQHLILYYRLSIHTTLLRCTLSPIKHGVHIR